MNENEVITVVIIAITVLVGVAIFANIFSISTNMPGLEETVTVIEEGNYSLNYQVNGTIYQEVQCVSPKIVFISVPNESYFIKEL